MSRLQEINDVQELMKIKLHCIRFLLREHVSIHVGNTVLNETESQVAEIKARMLLILFAVINAHCFKQHIYPTRLSLSCALLGFYAKAQLSPSDTVDHNKSMHNLLLSYYFEPTRPTKWRRMELQTNGDNSELEDGIEDTAQVNNKEKLQAYYHVENNLVHYEQIKIHSNTISSTRAAPSYLSHLYLNRALTKWRLGSENKAHALQDARLATEVDPENVEARIFFTKLLASGKRSSEALGVLHSVRERIMANAVSWGLKVLRQNMDKVMIIM